MYLYLKEQLFSTQIHKVIDVVYNYPLGLEIMEAEILKAGASD